MSERTNPDFREALINEQPLTPSYRQRYEKEIKAMFQTELTPRSRRLHVVSIIACVTFAIFGVVMVAKLGRGQPALSAVWIAYTLGNAFTAAMLWRTLRRGSFDVREGAWRYSKFNVAATLFIMIMIIIHAVSNPTNTALVWCIMGAVCLMLNLSIELRNRVVQSEYLMREKLLGLEYRLIELSERLANK